MSDRQLNYYGHEDEEDDDEEKKSARLASLNADVIKTPLRMIDTFDRPGDAYAESKFARAGTYKKQSGERIPKTGAYAETAVRRARAEFSGVQTEAKSPNASVGYDVSGVGVGAMGRAELGSVSAKAGPVGVKVGLGVDTGASIGLGGVEAKVLGTGFTIGKRTSVSVLGSEVGVDCSIM